MAAARYSCSDFSLSQAALAPGSLRCHKPIYLDTAHHLRDSSSLRLGTNRAEETQVTRTRIKRNALAQCGCPVLHQVHQDSLSCGVLIQLALIIVRRGLKLHC